MSLEGLVLSEVSDWCRDRGLRLRALILFGSYVYNAPKARDVDVVVVVDRISNPKELASLATELAVRLRKAAGRVFDVLLFDEESFYENLQPGTVLSGLVMGFKALYDEIGVSRAVEELVKLLAGSDYKYCKGRRCVDLSAVARAKIGSWSSA